MIDQIISHYRILHKLGQGGMGTVYVAEDLHLQRRVAIKFPLKKSHEYRLHARFLREARAVSQLNHPNIAAIYDYGETEDGQPFIVMELVNGRTLSSLIEQSKLSVTRAVEIIEDVARALGEAHAHGIIHRDIKPSNVIIDERKVTKVLDFGLAKDLNAQIMPASDPEARTVLAETQSGMIVGTPFYLSPEQARSQTVDARSDLFVLGVLLYESIAGKHPFFGNGMLEVAAQIIHINPKPPSAFNYHIPEELDRISMKALAKRPEERYQTAQAFIADLESVRGQALEGNVDHVPTQRISVTPTAATSTMSRLSDIFVRPRFSFGVVVLVLALFGALMWTTRNFWRSGPHPPSAEAQRWYQLGTNALREGTYYKASQALQQATSADHDFALAHARLAEAWTELDYSDKAKDETIQATSLITDRSLLQPLDALYLQGITDTISRNFQRAINEYTEILKGVPDTEKAYAYFDLGRAYEKNEDLENAVNNYKKAIELDPQFAPAFVRLGVLFRRKQDFAEAESAFQRAIQIYRASSNFEGVAEALYQLGVLYDSQDKSAEAKTQLEESLTIARATGNQYQEIKSKLQLSSVLRTAGDTTTAQQYANEVIQLAQANGLENLTTSGLIDLGNAYFSRSDFERAEQYFKQALDYAQRYKGRRNEARALLSLGSLKMSQDDPDDALAYVEKALRFYQDGGYRQETAQALLLLGRANRQKGDYDAALRAFQQQLDIAQQEHSVPRQAFAEEGLGTVLLRRELYPEALNHFESSYSLFSKSDNNLAIAYNMMNRASMLLALGRYKEANEILAEASEKAVKVGNKQLQVSIDLETANGALSERNFINAKAKSKRALDVAIASEFKASIIEGKRTLGLASALSAQYREGIALCTEALELAEQLKDPWVISKTQLALAQSLLESGDVENALTNALAAQDTFTRTLQHDSEWQAFLILARAMQRKGDAAKTREYADRCANSFASLEQAWGKDPYSSYLSRPDVAYGRQQLQQLLPDKK